MGRAGRQKHVPQRTCIVCRQKRDKRELTRLVLTPAGLVVDQTGKRNGRGAYLCERRDCWDKIVLGRFLEHALRAPVTASDKATIAAAAPPRPGS